jgi:hypothetical protein
MITVSFGGSDQRVIAALRTKAPQLEKAETDTLKRLMQELAITVRRKLSGEVLQAREGGLLRSVRSDVNSHFGNLIGRVQAGGGMLWWARVHEYGGEKTYPIEPVNKLALAFLPTGSAGASFGRTAMTGLYHRLGARRGSLRESQYEEFSAAGGVVVKKVMHPPLKRRAFMGPSLDEMRSRIISEIYKTAAKAVKG